MNKNSRRRPLTLVDRERIAAYKVMGKSRREIGLLLNRNHSVISRELRRNSRAHPLMRGYVAHLAHKQAKTRKKEAGKRPRLKNNLIKRYVHTKLKLSWTPEQISGSLSLNHKGFYISHEAIYQYIYSDFKEGIQHLVRKYPKRYPRNYSRKRQKSSIPGRVSVADRPNGINIRWYFGHWETDALESNQSRCIINVTLERKSRLVKLSKLPTKHARHTHKALCDTLIVYPRKARQSITYDNGSENCDHLETNQVLGTKSYFCEPYHSWEKGAVENINNLIRRFIPKKTDLSKITREELQQIEDLLNDRPRKCLGFKTPRQVFSQYCK